MPDIKEITAFFDSLAENWDKFQDRDDGVIADILDNAGVTEGTDVLDVACGTGILVPYYLSRRIASVCGIDISRAMTEKAKRRFSQENVKFVCADAETYTPEKHFDAIVIYNAFPHFISPEAVICNLSGLLKRGGRLTAAHGAPKRVIDEYHIKNAASISLPLPESEELALLFARYLTVEKTISDDRYYQVVGVKD